MLLTFFAFGIYNMYFMYTIQSAINKQTRHYKNPILLILFEILSLGLYYTYWCYEVENIFKGELSNNKRCDFSFVMASIFKPTCNSLIQSVINENIFEEEEKKRISKFKLLKEKITNKKIDENSFFDYSEYENENKNEEISVQEETDNKETKTDNDNDDKDLDFGFLDENEENLESQEQ